MSGDGDSFDGVEGIDCVPFHDPSARGSHRMMGFVDGHLGKENRNYRACGLVHDCEGEKMMENGDEGEGSESGNLVDDHGRRESEGMIVAVGVVGN